MPQRSQIDFITISLLTVFLVFRDKSRHNHDQSKIKQLRMTTKNLDEKTQ